MDESLFLLILFCSFLLLASIIYCFLSTCLGLQIRRSDIWESLSPSSTIRRTALIERDRRGYEYDLQPTFGVAEEFEMMRTSGPGRNLY